MSEERKCRCSFRQKMVGDGCDVCNPELAAELAACPECLDKDCNGECQGDGLMGD